MSTKSLQNYKAQQIFEQIYNLSNLKQLDRQQVLELFEQAVNNVILGQYDEEAQLEFVISNEENTFRIINHNKVVVEDNVTDEEKDNFAPAVEVELSRARLVDPNIQVGDSFSEEVDLENFNKKDYQKILSGFTQSLKELEKSQTVNKYSSLIGEVVRARFQKVTNGGLLFELQDGTSAFMPSAYMNNRLMKSLTPGQLIDAYIEQVKSESKNAPVVISSVEAKLLQKLFAKNIPEVAAGYIEIVKIARRAGERSKVAIRKTQLAPEGMQELGAIIGDKSERIDVISKELNGEKIDVIPYEEDINKFIMNALSPAKVIDLVLTSNVEGFKSFMVIVPNTQHTLAIGKKGQNVSLASELTKTRLDILSQQQADEKGIKYSFENGNITQEETILLEEGKRLQSNFKRNFNQPKKPNHKFNILESSIDIDEFDADLAELRQKAQVTDDVFEKHMFSNIIDEEIEKNINDLNEELNDTVEDYDIYSTLEAPKKEEPEEDYEKITSTKMKDFHEDKDLKAGLADLDLSDLDDEDW
ncbi:transcription termination factor NusA [[Mycoplasma] falconis]|uniref:Transcription termination/antitermination protein NusA n=1 Tax=[Mycoplasma] falconis TaxID=92403 RepID=A0A501XB03_9BACT|nr:transcription termination factor NusA [[Mycoplasma] falconis]TPE57750.1 transcription termination factor NusA [[Mycoplasma] falconis]